MATTSIVTLTDTFQQISTGACFAQVNANIHYGFGAISPTVYHQFYPVVANEAINYNGNYGAMWMRLASPNTNTSATVTVV